MSAVAGATKQIDAARSAAVVPLVGDTKYVGKVPVTMRTGEDARLQRSLRSHAQRQTIKLLADIRDGLDKTVVPLIKTMNLNSDTAREMSERHWDIFSVLRRAKGASTGTSGLVEAMDLRESYTAILHACHPIELARWAQSALDTGDALLSDCVIRENFARSRDERAFANQDLLSNLQNADFNDAQALLASVTQYYQAALLEYSKFGREIWRGVARANLDGSCGCQLAG
ncbi:MAG: hypothetical protein M3Y27_29135 [Acidobacteriota bacterium]|nr:hypothetical protein [Acidobacteriota bacterium]